MSSPATSFRTLSWHRFRTFLPLLSVFATTLQHLDAQVDTAINEDVWKQKFGVLDAQMNEQAPYTAWLSQDADGDGVNNRSEFIAGTNPFKKLPADPHFRPPLATDDANNLSLSFPTVPGKFYAAESNDTLMDEWNRDSLPSVTGDGTKKTLTVPKNAGSFFRVSVTDRATQGDQVSDWAKFVMGLSPAAPIESQTSYNHNSLASELDAQNLVSLEAIDNYATLAPANTAAATDLGVIRITRSGYLLLGDVTVPLSKSGTAVQGIDYAPLPSSVTFPAGVNSLDITITPLSNAARTSSTTVFLTANAPGSSGASGNYTLGNPTSAGLTIYPASVPAGTGLTANYYPGSSSTYSSPLNFSNLTGASYSYSRTNNALGTATVTHWGNTQPAVQVGSQVSLQFTSGTLNVAAYNTLNTYTVVAPVTSNTFTVNIVGTNVPSSSTGTNNNAALANFNPTVTKLSPVIDYTWWYGSPNGNIYVSHDNYSVIWEGWLSPTTAGDYVFRLDADDKARVSIDTGSGSGFQQILENGWDTPSTNGYKSSAPITLATANRYPIRVEFVETTGAAKCKFQWQAPGGSFVTIPSANIFTTNSGTTAGWNGVYYDNPNFAQPIARSQTDTDFNSSSLNSGDWSTGSPDPLIFHNNFSCRWTGQVLPQYSQKYYFVTKANEGCKLWVNNQLLIDKWTGSSGADLTASIDLQADVLYDIKMESYEVTGSNEAHLSWYSDDQAKQIIPTHRLFPTNSGSPAITSPTDVVTILGSGSPFTMNVTSSNGGTITASGLPSWLTLVNGVLSGTPPAAGIYQFTLTTTNAAGTGSAVMTLEVQAPAGHLTREIWTSGVAGDSIAGVPWTATPSASDTVTTAEDNTASYGANTGERLRGYFTAPVTGNYYFWIAASNVAELWISNNAEPVNKVRRATVTGTGTPPRKWSIQPNQKSQWLSLIAGQKYYLEALHNTGDSGANNHFSVAWRVDSSGTSDPVADNCEPATATDGGILPSFVLSPWDNPPTTTVPGTLYVTNLQGVDGLSGITATGGAFLRVNGNTAVLQLNHMGLTSGITSRKIYHSAGAVLFDVGAQDKNYPAMKTSDGGYTWNMQPSDLAALNNGEVYLGIATVNHPTGEVAGTFGRTAGSQTAPAKPAYPSWTDLHATSDAANSRFLTQATFGPSTSDMDVVKTIGYQQWIENQFNTPPTKNVPYVLDNLSSDPNNPYGSNLMFNSWWKNSVTAPDQLRQRAAFALSEILVVSDVGPLNNNGRVLADYYDNLLDTCFGNFRDILKQVTLSPAMGVYLDMRANAKGDIQTGLHPNENYAREILQLFSAGLYRVWPDGTLVLDSSGNAVPTYDQSVITGMARVFTGWTWGQPMAGGRLPTSFSPPANYLDPMVLVPTKHELGSKILLDNVVLPAATTILSSDSSVDSSSTYAIQSTDPALGAGNLVTTTITNKYDLNGVKDLEKTLDNILENSATGPYICRQLIQRLVTSHPKPEYVYRVVQAFNGEKYVDSEATGVRGNMKEVFRAILLDYEARSTTAASDHKFGKQREPLLRVTGPARAFPTTDFLNSTYSQSGTGTILVTTRDSSGNPVPHKLISGSVRLSNFVDQGGASARVPNTQSYVISNVTANTFTVNNTGTSSSLKYTISGSTATIAPVGVVTGDQVYVKFTTGDLSGGTYDGTYTVGPGTEFTIPLSPAPASTTGGDCLVPKLVSGYNVSGSAGAQTITIQTTGVHNLVAGDSVQLKFIETNAPTPAINGVYPVTSVVGPNSFKVTPLSQISNGSQDGNSVNVFPLKGSHWTRNGTCTVGLSTWGITKTDNLNQTPLNSTTVFNFFYPDYQYPGAMAQAGMTTPEFQLTNDSNTMNLTNVITQGAYTNFSGATNGYGSFFSNNAIAMDITPYMTYDLTKDASIDALVDTLGVLLTGGNLSTSVKSTISTYVKNTSNISYSAPNPTSAQMRDRVRGIVHLITISSEYAIQK